MSGECVSGKGILRAERWAFHAGIFQLDVSPCLNGFLRLFLIGNACRTPAHHSSIGAQIRTHAGIDLMTLDKSSTSFAAFSLLAVRELRFTRLKNVQTSSVVPARRNDQKRLSGTVNRRSLSPLTSLAS